MAGILVMGNVVDLRIRSVRVSDGCCGRQGNSNVAVVRLLWGRNRVHVLPSTPRCSTASLGHEAKGVSSVNAYRVSSERFWGFVSETREKSTLLTDAIAEVNAMLKRATEGLRALCFSD